MSDLLLLYQCHVQVPRGTFPIRQIKIVEMVPQKTFGVNFCFQVKESVLYKLCGFCVALSIHVGIIRDSDSSPRKLHKRVARRN